jgi:hypothetical protein
MGEEKRRRQAGAYPTEGGDPGYEQFNAKLRKLMPKVEEREIGLAWMRTKDPNPEIPTGLAEAVPVQKGHVVMHVLCDDASLNAALPVEKIDETVEVWRRSGLSRQDTRQGIFDQLILNRHLSESYGNALMVGLFGLAFTSEAAPLLRAQADQGFLRITYTFETFLDAAGRQAINFRLAASDQRDPPASRPLSGIGPTVRPEPHK